jgi:hypothetical protein
MQVTTNVRDLIAALLLAVQSQRLTGNKLRQDLANWLSPADPSVNFNTADQLRHEGTAEWFTQSSVFKSWKESSFFLWVHGKRTSFSRSVRSHMILLTYFHVHSGLW